MIDKKETQNKLKILTTILFLQTVFAASDSQSDYELIKLRSLAGDSQTLVCKPGDLILPRLMSVTAVPKPWVKTFFLLENYKFNSKNYELTDQDTVERLKRQINTEILDITMVKDDSQLIHWFHEQLGSQINAIRHRTTEKLGNRLKRDIGKIARCNVDESLQESILDIIDTSLKAYSDSLRDTIDNQINNKSPRINMLQDLVCSALKRLPQIPKTITIPLTQLLMDGVTLTESTQHMLNQVKNTIKANLETIEDLIEENRIPKNQRLYFKIFRFLLSDLTAIDGWYSNAAHPSSASFNENLRAAAMNNPQAFEVTIKWLQVYLNTKVGHEITRDITKDQIYQIWMTMFSIFSQLSTAKEELSILEVLLEMVAPNQLDISHIMQLLNRLSNPKVDLEYVRSVLRCDKLEWYAKKDWFLVVNGFLDQINTLTTTEQELLNEILALVKAGRIKPNIFYKTGHDNLNESEGNIFSESDPTLESGPLKKLATHPAGQMGLDTLSGILKKIQSTSRPQALPGLKLILKGLQRLTGSLIDMDLLLDKAIEATPSQFEQLGKIFEMPDVVGNNLRTVYHLFNTRLVNPETSVDCCFVPIGVLINDRIATVTVTTGLRTASFFQEAARVLALRDTAQLYATDKKGEIVSFKPHFTVADIPKDGYLRCFGSAL